MSVGSPAASARLFVISAPSGCGKTTIAREILRRHSGFLFSVSATTRARRAYEEEGTDYFFLTPEEFRRRIAAGLLVEWEEIYGNLYGTLKEEVDRSLINGQSMLFDIDVKGAISIKRMYPHDAVLIFIKPPSLAVLEERLAGRKTEDPETLRKRLERVPMELAQAIHFDHAVVNDELERAVDDVDAIIAGTLHQRVKQ